MSSIILTNSELSKTAAGYAGQSDEVVNLESYAAIDSFPRDNNTSPLSHNAWNFRDPNSAVDCFWPTREGPATGNRSISPPYEVCPPPPQQQGPTQVSETAQFSSYNDPPTYQASSATKYLWNNWSLWHLEDFVGLEFKKAYPPKPNVYGNDPQPYFASGTANSSYSVYGAKTELFSGSLSDLEVSSSKQSNIIGYEYPSNHQRTSKNVQAGAQRHSPAQTERTSFVFISDNLLAEKSTRKRKKVISGSTAKGGTCDVLQDGQLNLQTDRGDRKRRKKSKKQHPDGQQGPINMPEIANDPQPYFAGGTANSSYSAYAAKTELFSGLSSDLEVSSSKQSNIIGYEYPSNHQRTSKNVQAGAQRHSPAQTERTSFVFISDNLLAEKSTRKRKKVTSDSTAKGGTCEQQGPINMPEISLELAKIRKVYTEGITANNKENVLEQFDRMIKKWETDKDAKKILQQLQELVATLYDQAGITP